MNRTSSFIVLASLFLLCPIIAMAQQQAAGRVTDALTGEPIPFATMYVSASKGTLTNEEGKFTIDLAAGETLQVSFMGYGKRQFAAGSVPETIRLEPTDTQMKEFTVVAPNSILEKIVKRLDSEYKARESKSANFFLRQTFEQENGRSEMVESFMNSASAVNLRKTAVLSARHYRMGTTRWWGTCSRPPTFSISSTLPRAFTRRGSGKTWPSRWGSARPSAHPMP